MPTIFTKPVSATGTDFIALSKYGDKTGARSVIRAIVEKAETNNGFICLTNYHSETGRIANYVLQPYGPLAYPRLVRESLEMLERQTLDLPKQVHGEAVSQEVWNAAMLEQIASFRKTLDGGHDREDRKVKIDKAFYELDGSVYVANVRIVTTHETPEQKAHNASLDQDKIHRVPKSVMAKAKDWLRKSTPVSSFCGQFRLDEDKFDRIAFSGIAIEFVNLGELFTS